VVYDDEDATAMGWEQGFWKQGKGGDVAGGDVSG